MGHFARAVAPLSARRYSSTMPTTTMSLFNARRAFVASKTSFGRAPSESDALLRLDVNVAGIQERKWLTPRRAIAVACVALVGCGIVVAGGMATKSEADPNRWWQASSSTCFETCFNTATARGNHISRQQDHPTECAYMTPTCARSDCTGKGLNKPGVPTCQDPQTACNAAPDAWWDTSSSRCYEACYNTASQCGNHVGRDWAGMCSYNGPVCARSDNACDGQGGNKPGVPPC